MVLNKRPTNRLLYQTPVLKEPCAEPWFLAGSFMRVVGSLMGLKHLNNQTVINQNQMTQHLYFL
jgi:hypothetical protein